MVMNWPNRITIGRLMLAIVFFALLGRYDVRESAPWLLDVCLAIFVVAGISDIVDGYLARKYGQETSWGRVLDPFVDKVLICGTFAFFAGPGFLDEARMNVTHVQMWMVVVIAGRELLVTSVRGFSEAAGQSFSATAAGKAKMLIQSITAGYVMVTVAHADTFLGGRFWVVLRAVLVWLTVIVTAASMLVYLGRARRVLAEKPGA